MNLNTYIILHVQINGIELHSSTNNVPFHIIAILLPPHAEIKHFLEEHIAALDATWRLNPKNHRRYIYLLKSFAKIWMCVHMYKYLQMNLDKQFIKANSSRINYCKVNPCTCMPAVRVL